MSTEFSAVRRLLNRFRPVDSRVQARQASPALQVTAAAPKTRQAGASRIAHKDYHLRKAWQLHMEVMQTPSNLM
jgi:hypothetical protein